jgi:hypothetical protein
MVAEWDEVELDTVPDEDAPHPVVPNRGPRVRVPEAGLTQISFDEIQELQLDCPFVLQI